MASLISNTQITLDSHQNWQTVTTQIPTPGDHELLIKVQAAAVNPIDLKRRAVTTHILGYDGYGKVLAIGKAVTQFKVGDIVYYAGSTQLDGSFQAYQCMTEALCALAPDQLSASEAAGLPLVSLTAYELLFEKFHFEAAEQAHLGKNLLIINGAGGVGSIMSQLAKWAGFTVYATSSPQNFNWLKANGVDYPVDYHQTSDQLNLDQLPADHFDAIAVLYDVAPYLSAATRLIKPLGHVGSLVNMQAPLDLTPLKAKSVSFDWEYMFTKTDFDYEIDSQGAILKKIARLADTNQIHSITTQVYQGLSVENLDTITTELTKGHAIGKYVLTY
ncbi:zinc-binding dehydrogenase [Latilactobacillus sakei]|uniref:alcohol dehydrogenase catalytic domain-containing protein n=1 Tax=Latilactobacillus sakei TaxID=1599 RepID=UPI0030795512